MLPALMKVWNSGRIKSCPTQVLVVLMAEHTLEEAKFANIRLAGTFFRTYLAPKATKYKEALLKTDIDAMVAATNLSYSAPGSWNDADMLQICSYGKGTTQGDPFGPADHNFAF